MSLPRAGTAARLLPTASHLDGVGEGQAHCSGAELHAHDDGEDAHRQHQDGAVQVAVEGEPQVEALAVEQGAVVLVNLGGGGGDKVLVLAKCGDDGQALQGLGNQADQVT